MRSSGRENVSLRSTPRWVRSAQPGVPGKNVAVCAVVFRGEEDLPRLLPRSAQ